MRAPSQLPSRLWSIAAAFAWALLAGGCTPDGAVGRVRTPTTGPSLGGFQPIIHTVDGKRLAFRVGDFQPAEIDHCGLPA